MNTFEGFFWKWAGMIVDLDIISQARQDWLNNAASNIIVSGPLSSIGASARACGLFSVSRSSFIPVISCWTPFSILLLLFQ
jgi:hypothetical protein